MTEMSDRSRSAKDVRTNLEIRLEIIANGSQKKSCNTKKVSASPSLLC